MNYKDKYYLRNKFMQLLDREDRRHLNCLRFGTKETIKHIQAKLNLAIEASQDGDFICEARDSKRLHRADIIIFRDGETPEVREIAVSESDESLEKKKKFWTGLGFEYESVRI